MPPPPSHRFFARPVLRAASVAAIALCSVPLAAQEGAADGMGTALEPVDLPDAREPVYEGEQREGLPQPEGDIPGSAPIILGDDREIAFEADSVAFDDNTNSLTASGDVILRNASNSVRADRVDWDRDTGQIVASGNVRFVDDEGNQLYTQRIELTEEFEAGAMEDLLLALNEGGRLAARGAQREADGTIILDRAAYSACAVIDPEGCDKSPSWRITAERVTYDPTDKRLRFRGAYLELFGARLLPLPGLALRTDGSAVSGILIPDLRFSESNGVEVNGSYYIDLGVNKDLTIGAYLYTEAPPMASAQYRHLTDRGAYQITAYGTYSRRISDFTGVPTSESDPRGYVFANGRFQLDPNWSFTGSLRLASDRTFLRRYDLSREDRLRSVADLERIGDTSYLSIAGWGHADAAARRQPGASSARSTGDGFPQAAARSYGAWRRTGASGEHAGDLPRRGAGHAACFRGRAVGPSAGDGARSDGHADRNGARRCLSFG